MDVHYILAADDDVLARGHSGKLAVASLVTCSVSPPVPGQESPDKQPLAVAKSLSHELSQGIFAL